MANDLKWEIGSLEIAKYARRSGSSGGSLPVYVPSLMPFIGMGTAKATPKALNPGCFCNANDCKPAIRKMLKQQNFITARGINRPFRYGYFRLGDTIQVEFPNGRLEQAVVSNRIDNSRKRP